MKIDVTFLPDEAADYKLKTVIIIDVLRASSTIVTAFSNGCKSIITKPDIKSARKYKDSDPEILLGGERKGLKVDGFDLGNSPLEYAKQVVKNKNLVLTTTNGTKAVESARYAKNILIGCFLNLESVVKSALDYEDDIIILCAGNDGRFSLEDTFCAGLMLREITTMNKTITLEDGAFFTFKAFKQIITNESQTTNTGIFKIISQTRHGKRLQSLNFFEDLKYCARLNQLSIVPKLSGGKFII